LTNLAQPMVTPSMFFGERDYMKGCGGDGQSFFGVIDQNIGQA
tara:strand:+ start:7925 stop:8053 length:129 start_codon:yes stop_codon:yes gene_type:complete